MVHRLYTGARPSLLVRHPVGSVFSMAIATQSPQIDNTFGSILIRTFVGLAMYGMTVQAAYRYFRSYPTDPLRLKAMISILVVLDTAQMIEACHACYHYLVKLQPSDASAMNTGVWSVRLLSVSRGITVFIVQMFYCRRISVLAPTYYKYLSVAMVPLMLSELGFSFAAAVEAFIVGTFTGWERKAWIDGAALVIVMVADIIVATTMVIILYKIRTGVKRTDSLLSLLIIYALNTCVLTSFLNALTLILLFVFPYKLIYVGLSISAAQMYSISVIAVVNSRKSFAKLIDRTCELGSFGLSDVLQRPPNAHSRSGLISPNTRPFTHRIRMSMMEENSPGSDGNKIDEVLVV